MYIYFCLVIYSLLTSFILRTSLKSRKVIYLFVNILPMIFIACLRDNVVGTDLLMYIGFYNNVIDDFDDYVNVYHIEYGYVSLNYIVNFLTMGSETLLLFVIAFITYSSIMYSFRDSSKNILISLLIFQCMAMYCTSFNLMKQYIAVAIICVSYSFLIKEKYGWSLLFCFIGSFFHRSCLIYLPLIAVYKGLKNFKMYYFFSGSVVVASVAGLIGYEFLVSFIPKYQALYVDSSYGAGRSLSASFFLGIIALVYLMYVNFKIKCFNIHFDKIREFNNILILIYGLVWILSYKVFIIHRLAPYFEAMLCFAIPYAIEKQKRYKNLSYIVFLSLLFVYYYIFLSKNLGNIVPYMMRI